MTSPHAHRQIAESFGVDPERYDRTRASYPNEMIDRILDSSSGTDVLNVGCGTGIEARQFLARGCTLLGVEPDSRMAEFARNTGVTVEIARFEDWDAAGRQFDAVVSGTAWHWVDPVAGAAKAAAVLRQGGVLAPFGHVYELPTAAAAALADAFNRAAPDSPITFGSESMLDAYQGLYQRAAQGIRKTGGFREPEIWRYDWERTYSRDELLDLIPTSGGMTRLNADACADVLTAVAEAVEATTKVRYATWGLTAIRA